MPDNTVPANKAVPANAVDADLLDRVRKLLAKAEDEGCSPAEAEALTAKAAELMARYGIDRALLGALHPETDKPADRVFTLANPWGDIKRHLLAGLAMALRCQCVQTRSAEGARLHVFGYTSDLERADILFTSLLVQMARALARQPVPGSGGTAHFPAPVLTSLDTDEGDSPWEIFPELTLPKVPAGTGCRSRWPIATA